MPRLIITRDNLRGNFICCESNAEPGTERTYATIDMLVKSEFEVYLEITQRIYGVDYLNQTIKNISDKISYQLIENGEYRLVIAGGLGIKTINNGVNDERKIDRKT